LGYSDIIRRRAPLGLAALLVSFGAVNASADTLYNDIPGTVLSLGSAANDFTNSVPFEENEVSSFGALISPTSTTETATQATIALSMWGTATQYGAGSATSFTAPITLTLYNVGSSSSVAGSVGNDTVYTLGSVIETATTDATIAYRPASNPSDGSAFNCGDGLNSYSNAGNEQCGTVSLVNFALNTTLPSNFVYVVSYATDGLGNAQVSPTDSLNYDLSPVGSVFGEPSAGSNPSPDTAYLVSTCGSLQGQSPNCNTSATTGNNIWDTGYGSLGQANIEIISGTPEPATFGLIGFGLVGLGFIARKKKNSKV
jgi:hypothetical protein